MLSVYAKSAPRETLREHTENCLSVMRSLRVALPHLPVICNEPDLWNHLFYAIYLHDLGKAATGFQTMLDGGAKWGYRHEILSAGFVPFLNIENELHARAIRLAIITHHKTNDILRKNYNTNFNEGKKAWNTKRDEMTPHWDFVLQWLKDLPAVAQTYLGKPLPSPQLPESLAEIEDSFKQAVWWFTKSPERTKLHSPYAILLRGLVVACDHLASGGNNQIIGGITDLPARLNIMPHPFQKRVGSHKGSALLVGPTGSGKTEAGLLWSDFQQDAGRRLFYVLPYTASINAMLHRFEDRYELKEEVGALHGKANYFLYEDLCEQNYTVEDAQRQTRETLNLSRHIYRPIKILTPFQIIKAFFGVKGWEMQWAELAGGLFIFDEIHVYDARTTALLITALEELHKLDAKFLFMSATFPTFLKNELLKILPELPEILLDENEAIDRELLHNPRHRVTILQGDIYDYLDDIRDWLNSGKTALVVCNTVARAQEVFKSLRETTDNAALLHGRFILRDREGIEKRLDKVDLLVGTQAVEVSLDLDFDTIFTEPAPIDALIQRFGRVNRQRQKGVVPVHIFTTGSDKDFYIYDAQRISATLEVLSDGLELTEARVAEAIEKVYEQGYNQKEQATFKEARNAFKNVITGLVPFECSERDEDFYDLIKSVTVIPQQFESDFIGCLHSREYFGAMKFQATITLGQSMKLRDMAAIEYRTCETDKRRHSYYVAHVKYDADLGLLLDDVKSGGEFID